MSWNSELLTEQAQAVVERTIGRDPQKHPWGLFFWGDAPGGIGGGVGCFQWFDSREELLAFVSDYSPALYCSFEEEDEWIEFRVRLRAIAKSFSDDSVRGLEEFNTVLKGLLQIDWIDSFDELCKGEESFCRKVRAWFRDADDIDEAEELSSQEAIDLEEVQDFIESLEQYGF